MQKPKTIAVIGFGAWGAALSEHLCRCGFAVTALTRSESVVSDMKQYRTFSKSGSYTFSSQLTLTAEPKDISGIDRILCALPSGVFTSRMQELVSFISPQASLVSATKGFVTSEGHSPLEFLASLFPSATLSVISGPSFAEDLIAKRPLGVVLASSSLEYAAANAAEYSSDSFKIYHSDDTLGVEFGGIAKNVIALAAGMSDGMGLGDSSRAGLITRGLAEMMRGAAALGAKSQTLAGLSGLGDLAMTASSTQSRNYRVGFALGQGKALPTILQELGSVAEGVRTAPILVTRAQKLGVELPISEGVAAVVAGKITPKELVGALMSRPQRAEF